MLGLAHRVLVVRLGRIVAEFAGAEANEENVMRAAFGEAACGATEVVETVEQMRRGTRAADVFERPARVRDRRRLRLLLFVVLASTATIS